MRSVLYVLIAGIAVLLLLEVALRITGKFRTYSEIAYGQYTTYWNETRDSRFHSHNPNDSFYFDQPEFRYLYKTNSFGHRENEMDTTENGLRVFVFGDSFMEGVGAPYDSSWPRFLEQHLHRDSIAASVYVCGSAGSDPFDSYVSLKDQFLSYRPTHVLFTFNTSDLSDYAFRTGFQRFLGNDKVAFRKGEWWHGPYRYSHLVRAYVHSLGNYGPTLLKNDQWGQLQDEAVDSIARCLDLSNELCKANGIQFMGVSHSGPLEICLDDPASRSIVKIERHSYNVPILHLNDGISQAIEGPNCMDYGWPIDGHYNSKGYHIFAEVLWQQINREYPGFWAMTPVQR